MRLTDEDIERIERTAVHANATNRDYSVRDLDDVRALIAEVRRLRAELAEQLAERAGRYCGYGMHSAGYPDQPCEWCGKALLKVTREQEK